MIKKVNSKKAQISVDAVLAIMFLLIVSTMAYQNVYKTVENVKEVETVDRVNSIADTFENYALTSYSKNVRITVKLEPIGVKNYTIFYENKSISVNKIRTITFIPSENRVSVNTSQISDGLNDSTGRDLTKSIIIEYGSNEFYIQRNISINIE